MDIPTILDTLNENRIRATYEAVAEVLGMSPGELERSLQGLDQKGSWVVDEASGKPRPGFEEADGLFENYLIIRDAARLRVLVYATRETSSGKRST